MERKRRAEKKGGEKTLDSEEEDLILLKEKESDCWSNLPSSSWELPPMVTENYWDLTEQTLKEDKEKEKRGEKNEENKKGEEKNGKEKGEDKKEKN